MKHNTKLIIAMMVALLGAFAMVVVEDMEESDAVFSDSVTSSGIIVQNDTTLNVDLYNNRFLQSQLTVSDLEYNNRGDVIFNPQGEASYEWVYFTGQGYLFRHQLSLEFFDVGNFNFRTTYSFNDGSTIEFNVRGQCVASVSNTYTVTVTVNNTNYAGYTTPNVITDVPSGSSLQKLSSGMVLCNGKNVITYGKDNRAFVDYNTSATTVTSNITVSANYASGYSHTLNYDANNGTGAPSQQTHSSTTNTSYTFTISSIEPTRSGYVFMGWSESSTATTATYQPRDTITVPANGTKTLYAVWDSAYTIGIGLYNSDSAHGRVYVVDNTASRVSDTVTTIGTTATLNVGYGSTITFSAFPNTGYQLSIWSATSSGQPVPASTDNAYTTTATRNMALYAVFEEIPPVTWHIQTRDYDSNTRAYIISPTGFGTKTETTTYYDSYQTSASIANLSASVSMEAGCVFQEWKIGIYNTSNTLIQTVSGGTDPSSISWTNLPTLIGGYTYNIYVQFYQGITVGAISTAHGSVTVTSGSTTNTASHGATASILVAPGSSVTWSATMDSGYTFVGWETQMGGYVSEDNPYTATMSIDTIIVAAESPLLTVTINAGEGGRVSLSTVTNVPYGTQITVSNNRLTINGTTVTATPNTNWVFATWDNLPYNNYVIQDVTITATFSDTTIYYDLDIDLSQVTGLATVSYNGTPMSSSNVYRLASGTSYTLSISNLTTGYVFKEWYIEYPERADTDSSTSTTYSDTILEDVVIQPRVVQGITVGAISTAHGSVTVTSGSTTNTASHGATASILVAPGSSVTWSATMDSGYTFVGWETQMGGYVSEDNPFTSTVSIETIIVAYESPLLTVTIQAGEGGTVSPTRVSNVPYGTLITVSSNRLTINGTTVTATPTPNTNWVFATWDNLPYNNYVIQDVTITATFSDTTIYYDLDIDLSQVTGLATVSYNGTPMSSSNVYRLPSGTSYTLSISNVMIGYSFKEWYIEYPERADTDSSTSTTYSDTILEDVVIQPRVEMDVIVWWDNGYINGSVEIAFDFIGHTDSPTHIMTVPLWEYIGGPINLNEDPHGLRQFQQTPYTLEITNGYNQNITLKVKNNGQQVGETYTYRTGYWEQYALIIDAQSGSITFKGIHNIMDSGVSRFSFVNYKPVMETKIFDFSTIVKDKTIGKVYHMDTGSGEAPRFQVSATTTYLNTFGFVMVDPELNIYDKFPNYDNLRLNFYSFAYYGESVTINGHTMDMSGFDIINVYYIPKGTPIGPEGQKVYTTENIISNADDPLAKHAEIPLQNIYVTWTNLKSTTEADRICYLTFVDGGLIINMGTFNTGDLTVTMDGVWWFTTMLYEPYVGTESSYEMDWNSWFNLDANAFIIVFMVIAGGIFILMNKIYKPGFLDYAVVIGAGLISYMMLGGI